MLTGDSATRGGFTLSEVLVCRPSQFNFALAGRNLFEDD